eukprot:TRINITY_DN1550_c0_g3_i2.p1 TRINITY_DN1550_c0_g3~~TRINITY_DN1550_c0_g3_i2.p1  ORF type:complete len:637 (+),score=190.19 TRINITY_DN1550_c0_g3_i2:1816-3726(+)
MKLLTIGGDLGQRIAAKKHFPEKQILNWLLQVALALRYCHDRKVLHRDLKAKNIFLTADGAVKLGDFGIAKVLSHTLDTTKTIVGTPYYLSPEIIQNKPYGLESDIWSLGVLLYEMCALKPPFNARNLSALAMKITVGAYSPVPSQYSKELRQLIAGLLVTDPRRRMSIHKMLGSPLLQEALGGGRVCASVQESGVRSYLRGKGRRMGEKKEFKLHNQSVINVVESRFGTNETPRNNQRKLRRYSKEAQSGIVDIINYDAYKEYRNKIKESLQSIAKLKSGSRQECVEPAIKKSPSTVIQTKKLKTSALSSPVKPFSPKSHPQDEHNQERIERVKKREEERRKMKDEISKLKRQSKGRRDIPVCLVQHNYSTIATDTDLSEPATIKIPFIQRCTLMPKRVSDSKNYPNTTRISLHSTDSPEFPKPAKPGIEKSKTKCKMNEEKYLNQFLNPSETEKRCTSSFSKDKKTGVRSEGKGSPEGRRTLKEKIKEMRRQMEASGRVTLENFSEKDILVTRANAQEESADLNVEESKIALSYEDRGDLLSLTEPIPSQGLEDTISEFETIESIVYYLETEYGFEKFKQIYQVVKDTEETPDEKLMLQNYAAKLKDVIDEEALARSLFLFLSLKRAEEQAISN